MSTSRFNITLSDELKTWYFEKATKYGMSVSGLMVMALAQYVEQQEVVSAMNNMKMIDEKLKLLQDKSNK